MSIEGFDDDTIQLFKLIFEQNSVYECLHDFRDLEKKWNTPFIGTTNEWIVSKNNDSKSDAYELFARKNQDGTIYVAVDLESTDQETGFEKNLIAYTSRSKAGMWDEWNGVIICNNNGDIDQEKVDLYYFIEENVENSGFISELHTE